jgi:hypothetical protein
MPGMALAELSTVQSEPEIIATVPARSGCRLHFSWGAGTQLRLVELAGPAHHHDDDPHAALCSWCGWRLVTSARGIYHDPSDARSRGRCGYPSRWSGCASLNQFRAAAANHRCARTGARRSENNGALRMTSYRCTPNFERRSLCLVRTARRGGGDSTQGRGDVLHAVPLRLHLHQGRDCAHCGLANSAPLPLLPIHKALSVRWSANWRCRSTVRPFWTC